MKRLILCLAALTFCCVSCSEKKIEEREIHYKQAQAEIITWKSGTSGALDAFCLVLCSNSTDECLLTKETYAWFEMYSDNKLYFIGGYVNSDGVLHMTNESIPLYPGLPWGTGEESAFDYYQALPVASDKEGEYIFRIKFYQPHTDSYYVTPSYWMKLACEGFTMYYEIEKL